MNTDPTLDRARLGIEAELFLESELGRYLIDRAADRARNATDALIACSPTDVESNTRYRNEITICDQFVAWLEEAIAEGRIAADELRMEETE